MADPAAALATQIANIEAKTGQSMAQLRTLVRGSGLDKHAEVRAWLMESLSLGYGDANTVAHLAKAPPAASADADPLDSIYAGAKAPLRALHDAVMAVVTSLGPFEVAPKKGYVSLRRKKQFAMLGPATKDQIEIGLNAKDLPADARLKAVPPGGMCQYKVRLRQVGEVDKAVTAWLRTAFESAG